MASMLANTKSEIHFHVISNRLSDENKAKLSSLSERFPHGKWNYYGFEYDDKALTIPEHLTVETYYRFFLPAILPELERIIYIDGDTIINGEIAELWNEDLEGKIAGVVSDVTNSYKRSKILDLEYDWYYFNAGVLLLDLKKFSELYTLDNLPKIISVVFNKYVENNEPWYADQEVINYLIKGEKYAKFLSAKFNLEDMGHFFYPKNCKSLKKWVDFYNYPVIIHFIGQKKPWHLNATFMISKHWRLYYKYKALTPFYDQLDKKLITEYERRKKITKTEALLPTNIYIQLFWRDIFADSAGYIKQVIGNRKLAFWGAGLHISSIMTIFASSEVYPDIVVDGLTANYGKEVFEYTVQPAEMLRGKMEEYFVVLCMETKRAYDIVKKILIEYGYDENGFVHAYAEVYKWENRLLLSEKNYV
jgi:lipopolysaccharide biosynthesis glycosyltransferase